jgi:hypothetical protein
MHTEAHISRERRVDVERATHELLAILEKVVEEANATNNPLASFLQETLLPKVTRWHQLAADAVDAPEIDLDFVGALGEMPGIAKIFDVDLQWSRWDDDLSAAQAAVFEAAVPAYSEWYKSRNH